MSDSAAHDAKSKRPLSPHLQVYKLPYNAKLSIIGRGIGVVLAKIISLVFLCVIAVAWYPSILDPLMTFLELPAVGYVMLAGSFVVFFYLANGVRHVLWDFVIGVHHKTGFMTGHIAIIVSALLTLGLAICSFQSASSDATDLTAQADTLIEEAIHGE